VGQGFFSPSTLPPWKKHPAAFHQDGSLLVSTPGSILPSANAERPRWLDVIPFVEEKLRLEGFKNEAELARKARCWPRLGPEPWQPGELFRRA